MADTPAKDPSSPPSSAAPAAPSAPGPIEQVEIQSRAHRPLVFEVHGHGAIRLGAFETIKLPAFAVRTPALRALLAEGTAIVLEKAKETQEQVSAAAPVAAVDAAAKTTRTSKGVPKPRSE
jgi:hypothetical protein